MGRPGVGSNEDSERRCGSGDEEEEEEGRHGAPVYMRRRHVTTWPRELAPAAVKVKVKGKVKGKGRKSRSRETPH